MEHFLSKDKGVAYSTRSMSLESFVTTSDSRTSTSDTSRKYECDSTPSRSSSEGLPMRPCGSRILDSVLQCVFSLGWTFFPSQDQSVKPCRCRFPDDFH
jgi:hypothetical protein